MAQETKTISPHVGGQDLFVRTNVDVAIFGGILGGGKQCPVSSHVLTPYGWIKNGDLKVGDEICTPFNGVKRIAQLFPQGVKKVYKMYLSDGRVAECGLEHLWTFRTNKQRHKYINSDRLNKTAWTFTETTESIIERLNKGERLYLPTNSPIEFFKKDLPIPPYSLGVMIGDGCITSKSLSHGNGIAISNGEQDIIDRVYNELNCYRVRRNNSSVTNVFYPNEAEKIREYIKKVGLNTYFYNRFIPHEYLFSSIEQRKQLLAGLFDTDGSASSGRFVYSTTSNRLKDDVVHLARSLGYNVSCRIDKREKKYTTGEAYEISIQTSDEIFYSKKHKANYAKYIAKNHKYSKANCHTRIVKIEYDREEESQCLLVNDRDHLYLIDDFVVTHNSFAEILCVAEPSRDPNFRATFFRRTLGQLKQSGGLVDDFKKAYGDEVSIKVSDNPRVTFSTGAFVEMQQIHDESPNRIIEAYKGLQSDCICFDELTGFEWFTFTYLMTRCRGKAKWTGKIRATTNPSRRHWLRKWLDWYIMPNGEIDPDKSGFIRYFYIDGDRPESTVWGNSKEEVYRKCKQTIDRKLKALSGDFTYENLIKSFTFILGNLGENKSLTENNKDYVGSVAASGGKMSEALMGGNWNVDIEDYDTLPIPREKAREVEFNDEQKNNDWWITCDLADTGTDNFIAVVWNGFHIEDVIIVTRSTPRENAQNLMNLAIRYNIADEHIIYDAIRGTYINDYIEDAVQFVSYRTPIGIYQRSAYNLKDMCYLRLANMISNNRLSINPNVAQKQYIHQKLSNNISIMNEFIEECSVVKFVDTLNGKKRLLNKKEMNIKLGHSMDLLDPIAMRMLPCADIRYGEELTLGESKEIEEMDYNENIYNDSFWC